MAYLTLFLPLAPLDPEMVEPEMSLFLGFFMLDLAGFMMLLADPVDTVLVTELPMLPKLSTDPDCLLLSLPPGL